MQQPMQPIIQHLFQASSLDDVSRQRLEAFVEEYPSFGIGHYLLSRKLQSEGSERFAMETQKTNLYFTNPFWLQWQLDNRESAAHAKEPVGVWNEPAGVQDEQVGMQEEQVVIPEWQEAAVVAEEPAGDDLAETLSAGAIERLTVEEESAMTAGEGEVLAGEPAPVVPEENPGPSAAERLLRSIEEARGLRESLHRINDDF
ncbi:MAG TPA: hypothetical protein VNW04_22885, partial [Puia sp.]|nr:hypothetical protein [Puia sp.]